MTKNTSKLTALLMGLALASQGQTSPVKSVSYFNQFQQHVENQHSDSALYCAQQLAERNVQSANFLIHDSFAQTFAQPVDSSGRYAFASQLLERMGKGSVPLLRVVLPLQRWVEAQQHTADVVRMRQIVNELMMIQDRSEETIGNRVDRYALLIYRLIKPRPEYHSLADSLLAHTQRRLDHATNGIYYQSINDDRNRMSQRAYFRFLNACLVSGQAEEAEKKKDVAVAQQLYKRAAELSPDENDSLVKSAFFYESYMLLGREVDDFYTPYVAFLEKQGSKPDTILALMTKRALLEPSTLNKLQTFYEKAGAPRGPFRQYWREQLNAPLKPAEPFRLTELNQTVFDYQAHKGKWVLLDFWGTWCQPCVAELPEMQRFYERMKTRNDIVVLTIACQDQENKVRDFMAKNSYTFPVAMADITIERQFRVGEYPTKVLITPQGKRMKIPFATNWVSRVDTYLANQ